MKKLAAFQTLQKTKKRIFSLSDLRKLLRIEKDNTAYKQVEGLIEAGVLSRIAKGYYYLAIDKPSDFAIANILCRPSYISMESALNYYGILIQTPQEISSVTPLLTKRMKSVERDFLYHHLDQKYYTDYQKTNDFVIATPEKALIDTIYFAALRGSIVPIEEMLLDQIDRRKTKEKAKKIANLAFQKYFSSFKL